MDTNAVLDIGLGALLLAGKLAAPILVGSRIVASLSILVPTYRIDDRATQKFGQLIAGAARRLSAGLADGASAPKDSAPKEQHP